MKSQIGTKHPWHDRKNRNCPWAMGDYHCTCVAPQAAKPIILEYTPAPGAKPDSPSYAQRFEFTRDDDAAMGDIFSTAVGWLHMDRGEAFITDRQGRRVKVVYAAAE